MIMNDQAITKTLEKALQWYSRHEKFTLAITWRTKALEEDEEPSDTLTWHATPRSLVDGKLRCSFAETKGFYDFPRGDVEYLSVKFVRQAIMGVDAPCPTGAPKHHRVEQPVSQQRVSIPQAQQSEDDWEEQSDGEGENTSFVSGGKHNVKKLSTFSVSAGIPATLTCFFPHVWAEMLQHSHVTAVTSQWVMSMMNMEREAPIKSETVRLQQAHVKQSFVTWLQLVARLAIPIPQIPFELWKVGHNIAEQLLMFFALAIRGPPGVAKMVSEVEDLWAKNTITYSTAIKAVKAMKTTTQDHAYRGRGGGNSFRGGRGRGGHGFKQPFQPGKN